MKRKVAILVGLLSVFLMFTPISAEELPDYSVPGTYFVTIEAENENGEIVTSIMKITVTGEYTEVSEVNEEAIDARDFRAIPHETVMMTHKELVEAAHARAWSTNDGLPIEVYSSRVEELSARIFKVTYTTKRGTSTTIKAVEFSENFFQWDEELIDPVEFSFFNVAVPPMFLITIMLIPLVIMTITYSITRRRIGKAEDILYQKYEELRLQDRNLE